MLYSANICYNVLRYAIQDYDYMLYKAKICYTVLCLRLTYVIYC